MTILITGAAGFIGFNLIQVLSETTSHKILGLDIAGASPLTNGEVRTMDIGDRKSLERLFKTEEIDFVVHLAALSEPAECSEDPLRCYNVNVANTVGLLQMCIDYDVRKFIFASSAAVFGGDNPGLIPSDARREAVNPYGRAKLMCEQMLEDTVQAYPKFKYAILRFFAVVGDHGPRLVGSRPHFMRIAAQAALGKRDKVIIFGTDHDTPDGTCVRDYTHVEDVARAISASITYLGKDQASRAFNCGTGISHSLKAIVDMMKRISGVDFEVQIGPSRPQEYASLVPDISAAQDLLGWNPEHIDLESLCRLTLEAETSQNVERPSYSSA